MYFKRLELYGFKSFADKTAIDLDDGITGIVGPNGSGKSNFSDAIKWVLGEQRVSELRGKSMQDVIFNGTQKRGSMSYCEVSLVFDNTDRAMFPSLEFDEVKITRKLYRSGDSEYLLNNITCRLKDIRDLVSDTGLGKDGFSIIGQGQVAKIINSKPEDRRTIFEEAAGISKYKQRKNETENKLKRTREHLDRLGDIIHEIERNLGPLEKQAGDAKKYNEYYNELRELEVNHYLYTYENNKVIKVEIAKRLAGIAEEMQQLDRDVYRLDMQYRQKLADINNTDVLIGRLRDEQTTIMVDNERRQGQNNVYVERLNAYNTEIGKTRNNISRMKEQLESKESERETLEADLVKMQTELDGYKAQFDDIERKYTAVVDDILEREREIESSSRAILDAMGELANVKADLTKLSTERDMLLEKSEDNNYLIERNNKLIEEEQQNRTLLEKQLDKAKKERDDVYKTRVALRTKANELKLENNFLVDEVRSLAGSISALEARKNLLKQIKNQYEGFHEPVQRLMNECKTDPVLKSKIVGVVAELINVPQRLEVAIETALGAALQNIVAKSDDDVKYAIELLKRKRLGRITFLPINSMKPRELSSSYAGVVREDGCVGIASKLIKYDSAYNNIFSGLLGSTVICDTYDSALRLSRKYNRGFKIVTLEGEILSTQGSITGGSRKSDSSNILSQERQLEKTEQDFIAAKAKYEAKSRRLTEVKAEYEQCSLKLIEADELLQAKEIEYATATDRNEKSGEKLDSLNEELKSFVEARDKIERRLELIELSISHSDKLEGDISGKRASVNDVSSKSKMLFEERKREKEELIAAREKVRLNIAEIESRKENTQEDIDRIKNENAVIIDAIEEDTLAIETMQKHVKLVQDSMAQSALTPEDKAKLEKLQAELKQSEEYKKKLNEDIVAINADKDEKNRLITDAAERKVKQENSLERIDATLAAMTARLLEEYDIDHERALTYAIPDFDDTGAATNIANIKRNITKLGVINVSAIEQYETESARYNKLAEERDDLEKGESELVDLVKELSKEMLERFETEFAKISKSFEQTFKDIFGGGKGELVVDKTAEDPLAAGIEIYAQPPGKKLQQISLFSGGEMALTAIAILFAILKNRPMPFCVLDEIEAALDESNARLFAKYLKRFVDETQFIVITHRKPTMEQADRLYGVTMEEKGVSKVVSVALSEAFKAAKEGEDKAS